MSALQSTMDASLVPSPYETVHEVDDFEGVLAEVIEVIAPVWPLKDYVAVNPYAGISQRSFMHCRSFLRLFSDCEMLMPIEHYAAEFHCGRFALADIQSAIDELALSGDSQALSAAQIAANLKSIGPARRPGDRPSGSPNLDRPIRTIAELATSPKGMDWTEAIVEELSKHCAAHYDQGQAAWSSPHKHQSLYQAWRTIARYDCNIEILGLKGFRKYVAALPQEPEAAIVHLLQQLRVPRSLWSTFLLCQAFSVPGWSAWTKYQSSWTDGSAPATNDLVGLLAIRLAYDAALAEAKSLSVKWGSLVQMGGSSFKVPRSIVGADAITRLVLLRASEIAYRNRMLPSLSIPTECSPEVERRKLAQMVFCIDVRSERIRRQLEWQSSEIETSGFAGFFGMAFEYATLGEPSGNLQLPVLLKPQFTVHECIRESDAAVEATAVAKRQRTRSWRAIWKGFQTSAVGCFSCVETTGLFYGVKLLCRALGYRLKSSESRFDGPSKPHPSRLGPTLRGLSEQGIDASRQADMAEGMLRNLGMTKNFAKLVVFCGHACQTENNPLAAALDCGACGGHSGEPNARFAAMLLNQSSIRKSLADRGITIPDDTHFVAALHNTTTDRIEFFDTDLVPSDQQRALRELLAICSNATSQTQAERLAIVSARSSNALLNRAKDWSEVRPEWGLAGNASFIIAPRTVTRNANLDARSFLHSYDYTQDPDGKVLETIMTAPMIVAHWINMQYYASTVDNDHFGSGNKTVHNVVGGFGILSGNGGDLMTGLPWQSLHTGDQYQHLPMRLQVVIASPLPMIDRVIARHQLVSNLLSGGWLHLVAIEGQAVHRFTQEGIWVPLMPQGIEASQPVAASAEKV
ncbi:MAG: YbcC family protein [Planctomycetaceae bacterium]